MTGPLPENGRQRPSTVEFPTLESSVDPTEAGESNGESTVVDPVDRPALSQLPQEPGAEQPPRRISASFLAVSRAETALLVAGWGDDSYAEPESSPAELQLAAPEPAQHPARMPAPPAATAPVIAVGRRPRTANARASARAGQDGAQTARARTRPTSASPFSEAEAAFFAAGDAIETGEGAFANDELDRRASRRPPPLWRRLLRLGR